MGEYATMRLLGAREIDDVLRQLPKEIGFRTMVSALRAAAKPLVADIKARAPVGTVTRTRKSGTVTRPGGLRDSIAIKGLSRRKEFSATMIIGPRWPQGAHGHLVEFGTSKTAARPFMRPAWDAAAPAVLGRLAEELGKRTEKAAEKLAGPLAKSGLVKRRRRRRR